MEECCLPVTYVNIFEMKFHTTLPEIVSRLYKKASIGIFIKKNVRMFSSQSIRNF